MSKYKDFEKESKIIQAAVTVISEKGYFKASITEIAKIAGVAEGTIYTYFKNKEDLLIRSFENVLDTILNKIRDELLCQSDPFSKIKIIVTEHTLFMEKNPQIANFLQIQLRQSSLSIRQKIKDIMKSYYKILGEILKDGINRGMIRSDVDIRIIGHMIFGTVDLIITSWVLSDKKDKLSDKIDNIYKVILSALKS